MMVNRCWAIALLVSIATMQTVAPKSATWLRASASPVPLGKSAQPNPVARRGVERARSEGTVCPDTLEALMPPLLRDLPSYANRVVARSRSRSRTPDLPPSYVLLAGPPDYRPLPADLEDLGLAEYEAIAPDGQPQQVFFTTLERQYGHGGYSRIQGFYWVFLTQQAGQWQLAGALSSLGGYPVGQPASPPRDSSEGVVAQAIRLWLRDCHAGAVRPTAERPES